MRALLGVITSRLIASGQDDQRPADAALEWVPRCHGAPLQVDPAGGQRKHVAGVLATNVCSTCAPAERPTRTHLTTRLAASPTATNFKTVSRWARVRRFLLQTLRSPTTN